MDVNKLIEIKKAVDNQLANALTTPKPEAQNAFRQVQPPAKLAKSLGMKKQSGKNSYKKKYRDPRTSFDGENTYTGPIMLPRTAEGEDTAIFNTSYFNQALATGTGTFVDVYGTANITSIADWSSISQTWAEIRVLGMELIYQPTVSYQTAGGQIYNPILCVVDRSTTGTALSSYSSGATYDSAKLFNSRKTFRIKYKMNGSEESQFQDTNSVSSVAYFKFFGNAFVNSSTIGALLITFLVQVRNRR